MAKHRLNRYNSSEYELPSDWILTGHLELIQEVSTEFLKELMSKRVYAAKDVQIPDGSTHLTYSEAHGNFYYVGDKTNGIIAQRWSGGTRKLDGPEPHAQLSSLDSNDVLHLQVVDRYLYVVFIDKEWSERVDIKIERYKTDETDFMIYNRKRPEKTFRLTLPKKQLQDTEFYFLKANDDHFILSFLRNGGELLMSKIKKSRKPSEIKLSSLGSNISFSQIKSIKFAEEPDRLLILDKDSIQEFLWGEDLKLERQIDLKDMPQEFSEFCYLRLDFASLFPKLKDDLKSVINEVVILKSNYISNYESRMSTILYITNFGSNVMNSFVGGGAVREFRNDRISSYQDLWLPYEVNVLLTPNNDSIIFGQTGRIGFGMISAPSNEAKIRAQRVIESSTNYDES